MAKEEFNVDLDFDLSKYKYETKDKPLFTLDDILGVSSALPADDFDELPKIDAVKSDVKVEQARVFNKKEERSEASVKAEISLDFALPAEEKTPASYENIKINNEAPTIQAMDENKLEVETPAVNIAAFDAIKAQEKKDAKKNFEPKEEACNFSVADEEEGLLESEESEENREDVLYTLNHLKKKITVKASIMFVLFLCGAYLLLGRISFLNFIIPSQFNPVMNPFNYCVALLTLSGVCFLLNISPLFDGMKKAFSARLTADGVAFCLGIACIVYDVYYVLNPEKFAPLMLNFDIVFILMLWMNLMGKRLLVKHIGENYELISVDGLKSIVSGPYGVAIDNDIMIETGNGGDILYASKTKNVADYMNKAFAEQNVNRKTDVFYFCVFGAIAFLGILLWLFKAMELQRLIILLVSACAICAPVFATWTHTLSAYRLGRFLRSKRTMISGREGATAILERGVIVVRDTDLIATNDITLRAMNVREEYDSNAVVRYLSALFAEVGGPLQGFFDKILSDDGNELLEVSDVYYHEQLGYTFTVDDKRLSVGTDEFMHQCRIECPINPAVSGTERIYVAIEDQLVAVFSLTYQLSQKTVTALRLLEDEGVSVAILTVDFNLRETMFNGVVFDPDMITVLSDETAKSCMTLCSESDSCPAEIVTFDAISGMAQGLSACNRLLLNCEKHSIYRITATLFGLLIILLLGYLSPSLSFWLPLQILGYQILWSLPNFLRGIRYKKI